MDNNTETGPDVSNKRKIIHIKLSRKCVSCGTLISNYSGVLSWQVMEFCNATCLKNYQKNNFAHCSNCFYLLSRKSSETDIHCTRFDNDIHGFCSTKCYRQLRRRVSTCVRCDKAMYTEPGKSEQQLQCPCILSYRRAEETAVCSICSKLLPVKIVFWKNDGNRDKRFLVKFNENKFCSVECFAVFNQLNKQEPLLCDTCGKYFVTENSTKFSINTQANTKYFCSKICQSVYIVSSRIYVSCYRCNLTNYSIDMIGKHSLIDKLIYFCSLNCLKSYERSVSSQRFKNGNNNSLKRCANCKLVIVMNNDFARGSDKFCSLKCMSTHQQQSKGSSFKNYLVQNCYIVQNLPNANANSFAIQNVNVLQNKDTFKHLNTVQNVIEKLNNAQKTNQVLTNLKTFQNSTQIFKIVQNQTVSNQNAIRNTNPVVINPIAANPAVNQASTSKTPINPVQNPKIINLLETKHQVMLVSATPTVSNKKTMCRPQITNKKTQCKLLYLKDAEVQTENNSPKDKRIPLPIPTRVNIPLPTINPLLPILRPVLTVPICIPIPVPVFLDSKCDSLQQLLQMFGNDAPCSLSEPLTEPPQMEENRDCKQDIDLEMILTAHIIRKEPEPSLEEKENYNFRSKQVKARKKRSFNINRNRRLKTFKSIEDIQRNENCPTSTVLVN